MVHNRVLWLGGSACAGKTTTTSRIEEDFRFKAYNCDDQMDRHAENAQEGSAAYVFKQVYADDQASRRFYGGSAVDMAEAYAAWGTEVFETIYDDVTALSTSSPVIVEGALIPPSILLRKVNPVDVLFVFSTPDFLETMWRERSWYSLLAQKTDNPQEAFENFVRATALISERWQDQCNDLGVRMIVTAGRIRIEESYAEVKRAFGLA
jgi:hypothetical protein